MVAREPRQARKASDRHRPRGRLAPPGLPSNGSQARHRDSAQGLRPRRRSCRRATQATRVLLRRMSRARRVTVNPDGSGAAVIARTSLPAGRRRFRAHCARACRRARRPLRRPSEGLEHVDGVVAGLGPRREQLAKARVVGRRDERESWPTAMRRSARSAFSTWLQWAPKRLSAFGPPKGSSEDKCAISHG